MIVVADTSPLNYLILIEQVQVLEVIFHRVIIPPAVQNELLSSDAPAPVRTWMESPPAWLEVILPVPTYRDSVILDIGESEAIALAEQLGVYQIVMDESAGRNEALNRGLAVIGTLGVLREAHRAGLLDFASAVDRLRATTFRISPQVIQAILNSL